MSARPGSLGRGDRLRIWLWSLALQGSWNPQRMQNLGLLAALVSWRRRTDAGPEDNRVFCRRYYEFFNTNPYLATFLIGGIIRLEQERGAGGGVPPGMARTFRDSLGRALASLGDQLFWMGLQPAVVLAACLAALAGWWPGALAVFGTFAAGQLVLRWLALGRGLALGMDLVDVVAAGAWHRVVAGVRRAGMILTGILVGSYVVGLQDIAASMDAGVLVLGGALGLGLPVLLRRRPPGEALILAAAVLAVVLSFAIPESGG